MNKISSAGKMAGGLALAAGVAAIAAGYYFYGKGGKTHRKQASVWSKKAKMEMVGKIKQMKDVNQAAYDKAAEQVVAKLKLVKNIDPKELQKFGQELKAHWKEIYIEAVNLSNKANTKRSEAKT